MCGDVVRNPKYSFFQKAVIVLYICLAALIVLLPIFWLFKKTQNGWGPDAAIVVLTLTFIVVIIIIVGGVGIGLGIDYAIRHHRLIFREPMPGSWGEKIIKLWGYTITAVGKKEEHMPIIQKASVAIQTELITIPEKAKRRGRKPSFPLPKWIEVALIWELRDPIFDTFSLSDIIAQKLGTASNGEPIIGDGAYYGTWRIPAIREINRLGLTSSPLSENLQGQGEVKELV
jgi:hypothetical protein